MCSDIPAHRSASTEDGRIAQRVGMRVAEHPLAHAAAKSPAAKKSEIANQRGTIVTSVRVASSTALREQTQVRSFHFVLIAVTGVMTCAAIGLGVMAWRSPSTIPLCFEPTTADETIVVCPTGQSGPLPAEQDDTTSPQDVDDAIKATVAPSDMVLVEVIGAIAATVAAAAAIRRTRGLSEPMAYRWPWSPSKSTDWSDHGCPGTATMRGEFIPGLSALTHPPRSSPGQLCSATPIARHHDVLHPTARGASTGLRKTLVDPARGARGPSAARDQGRCCPVGQRTV